MRTLTLVSLVLVSSVQLRAEDVDRTNPVATARALLAAYKAKDLAAIQGLSNRGNQEQIGRMLADGENAERLESVFSGWRYERVAAWNGEFGEVRMEENEARVEFDRSEDEVFVVTLTREDGSWGFEDIHSPSVERFATWGKVVDANELAGGQGEDPGRSEDPEKPEAAGAPPGAEAFALHFLATAFYDRDVEATLELVAETARRGKRDEGSARSTLKRELSQLPPWTMLSIKGIEFFEASDLPAMRERYPGRMWDEGRTDAHMDGALGALVRLEMREQGGDVENPLVLFVFGRVGDELRMIFTDDD